MMRLSWAQDLPHFAYWLLRHASTKYARRSPFGVPLRARPHIVELELTNDCNINCSFCYRTIMTRQIGYMDFDVLKKIADEMAGWRYSVMRMVGVGEPALHPRIWEILEYLHAKRIPLEITTNGMLLEKIPPKELLSLGIYTIAISVDGYDARSYNKIRCGGDYDKLRDLVTALFRAREMNGQTHPWIVIRNVIFPEAEFKNEAKIETFKAAWRGISDRIRFNTLEKFDGQVYDTGRVCDDIFYNLHVRWDGHVPLCAYHHLYSKQEWMGDVRDASLGEIWHVARWDEVRRNHISRDMGTSEFCRKCFTQQCQTRIKHNQKTYNSQRSPVLAWIERQAWRLVQ
jgi:MoaA/NifB/PqqE/SkfB family radical SAM enzyme